MSYLYWGVYMIWSRGCAGTHRTDSDHEENSTALWQQTPCLGNSRLPPPAALGTLDWTIWLAPSAPRGFSLAARQHARERAPVKPTQGGARRLRRSSPWYLSARWRRLKRGTSPRQSRRARCVVQGVRHKCDKNEKRGQNRKAERTMQPSALMDHKDI